MYDVYYEHACMLTHSFGIKQDLTICNILHSALSALDLWPLFTNLFGGSRDGCITECLTELVYLAALFYVKCKFFFSI